MALQKETGPRTSRASTQQVERSMISRWRIYVMLLVCLLVVVRIGLRLAEVQVAEREVWADRASREINQHRTLQPDRGVIRDRLGNVLAMDIERESLWVVPHQIPEEDVERLALTLSPIINVDVQELRDAMAAEEYYWLPVARWLEPEVAEQIEALGEPGLQLQHEPLRYYPQDEFAAHIIGAVNRAGEGISGVEGFYNTELKGITGTLTAEFDGGLNPIAIAPQQTRPPRDGTDLVLTIDPVIQYLAETELQATVQQHQADSGTIIVLEPSTGAIRAMASWPPFNPNRYTDYAPEVYNRTPAVSDLYEPGSTFKMVTVAAGLQAHAFTADTQVNDTGVIYRYGYDLKNWNAGANGMIDPAEVLYYSSNVGALQLNELTGPEAFYHTVRAFGFGEITGVDLMGEEKGLVHDTYSPLYNDLTFLTNAYGQGISVTPLQMTTAAATIANNGVAMRPYVVEQQCKNDECVTTEPVEQGQVLDPGVAWTLRRMLVRSANHYAPVVWASQTNNWSDQWLVPGYQVGAKTGTSSIPLPGGGYDPSYTIGSVLGFAPAENARYAILVKVDRPKDDIWGVSTAIPLYYNIVDALMQHERLPPDPQLFSPGQAGT
jgi:cell division protein FtsI (penicillin-binding protein 3)